MGDEMCTLVISVDLSRREFRQAIQEYLCNLQSEDRSIVSIAYDEKKNVVRVSGLFNPNKLKRTLDIKLRGKINGIYIQEPPPKPEMPEPPPPKMPEPPPPKMPEPPPMYPWPPKQPMYPWPPQVAMVCFVCPCTCMTAWSNNYRSCSCGVERWPGRCRCGSRWGSGPHHGDHPQWGCEPSQQRNIGYESMPSIGYESTANIGYESSATIGYESTANFGYESTPSIGYESTEPSCSIM